MKRMKSLFSKLLICSVFLFAATGCFFNGTRQEISVKDVMDKTISGLYQKMSAKELSGLDNDQVMALFSEQEKQVLSTRHWMFDVNVPVVVSVMRSEKQKIVPFWLSKSGFVKTELTIKNEQTTYEVWQKSFGVGKMGLGVNGFEDYPLHYFVSVAPQNENDKLELSNFFPENQFVGVLKDSAFTYHDWDELVLSNVPEALKGQKLLTTIRDRGVEMHLIGAFRTTDYPSSKTPDQVMLTWSSNPSTGIDIQWRTDTTVADGMVKYRVKGNSEELSAAASRIRMEDRVLMNDRYINHFTAELRDLKPGTTYEYQVAPQSDWSGNSTFTTAADDDPVSYTHLTLPTIYSV